MMQPGRVLAAALAAIAVSAAAAGGVCSAEHLHAGALHRADSHSFVSAMNAGMTRMMEDMHGPGYTGNPDIDFLAMMIPHHEGAVEMARLLLVHGADPVTRKLAEDIIAGQQIEIEGMRRRLERLRRGESLTHPDGFPALGGTRSPARAD